MGLWWSWLGCPAGNNRRKKVMAGAFKGYIGGGFLEKPTKNRRGVTVVARNTQHPSVSCRDVGRR
jgi:hypothetical protein